MSECGLQQRFPHQEPVGWSNRQIYPPDGPVGRSIRRNTMGKFIAATLVAVAALTAASAANAYVVLPPPVIVAPVYVPPVIVPAPVIVPTCIYTPYGPICG